MKESESSVNTHYDIAIVGGGLVGACLARAMSDLPIKIAIVEAVKYQAATQPSFDDRALALSFGSRRIFEGLGLWQNLSEKVTPIHHIHVSEQSKFAATRISATQEDVDALGYVLTARQLGLSIIEQMQTQQNLTFYMPAEVVAIDNKSPGVAKAELGFIYQDKLTAITANLVVAADGGKSTIRNLLNISTRTSDYRQTAVVTNIIAQLPHKNVAYERFTRHGPLALLPMQGQSLSLVWTQTEKSLDSVLQLSDADFNAEVQAIIGNRLGKFTRVGRRLSYPLQLTRAKEQTRPRLVLVGNAVHTLHPVAGQGFNLGLRDIAVLAQVLSDAIKNGVDVGDSSILQDYVAWRKSDHAKTIGFTHALVKIFSNNIIPLPQLRNLGLLATDLCPSAKHVLARTTMGLTGRLPRLARGMPL
ncbi:MAG: 2-octaprenyl-6-methoxyphenyl hydroxylase [Thiohalomonadales bacterium]